LSREPLPALRKRGADLFPAYFTSRVFAVRGQLGTSPSLNVESRANLTGISAFSVRLPKNPSALKSAEVDRDSLDVLIIEL
jgi:hypothetical protein